MILDFYKNKKVLLTGHTGFKGSWMCEVLLLAGAKVTGYALDPPYGQSMFRELDLAARMHSVRGDIRDLDHMLQVFDEVSPEIVIHMAAQPIVRESYRDPVGTYSTNVMGTVNILECIRQNPCVRSFVNVTTDKVYRNDERDDGYREDEFLDGYDPYSNSKSCSELVTASYRRSFFENSGCAISTCRAGNVIGGGDYAADRIIPDCIRAASAEKDIIVRNPFSTRPYQHVLEPIFAYLTVAARQYDDASLQDAYNIGPDDSDCLTTGDLAGLFCKKWNEKTNKKPVSWINRHDGGPHEAGLLRLNSTKLTKTFGWQPVWHIDTAVEKIVEWHMAVMTGESAANITRHQIKEYFSI